MIDQYFAPNLIGCNALNVHELLNKMNSLAVRNSFAKAAIEMALLDIKGKALNVPIYELFGGLVRESIEITWP